MHILPLDFALRQCVDCLDYPAVAFRLVTEEELVDVIDQLDGFGVVWASDEGPGRISYGNQEQLCRRASLLPVD